MLSPPFLFNPIVLGNSADYGIKHAKKGNTISTEADDWLKAAMNKSAELTEDYQKISAKLTEQQMKEQVTQTINSYMEQIKAQNESMREWETNMVLGDGYTVNGRSISRTTIVDSTLVNNVKKSQSVYMYEDFVAARPDITVSSEGGETGENMIEKIMLAIDHVKQWAVKIFGQVNADGKTKSREIDKKDFQSKEDTSKTAQALVDDYKESAGKYDVSKNSWEKNHKERLEALQKKVEEKGFDKLSENEQKEYTDLSGRRTELQDGAINEWIGYAPTFKDGNELDFDKSARENVKYEGMGQMGLIMLDFQWNSMEEGQGFAELAKPMYDKKMWDDNGSWLQPPTFRDVLDIVLEVVGNATGHKWIGYLDDLLFAATDLTGGYKTAGQVGLELGKKVATKAVSSGISSAASWAGDAAATALSGASTAANVAAQAGISVASSYATSVANSAINSFYIGENGLAFDGKGFGKSLYSGATIGGALGAGITAGLNEYNLGTRYSMETVGMNDDGTAILSRTANYTKVQGFNSAQISGMQSLNGLIGGLTSNAIGFAMDGQTTLNILNTADFGFGNTGLLELNLSKDGISSKIGMGGTNVSFSNLSSAATGAAAWNTTSKINKYATEKFEGSSSLANALRMQYGFGDKEQLKNLKDILNGDIKLELGGTDGKAQTVSDGTNKTIYMNMTEGMDWKELGLLLGHEAYRDGLLGTDEEQRDETRSAVNGHTEMALRMSSDYLYAKSMSDLINRNINIGDDIQMYLVAKQYKNDNIFQNYIDESYSSDNDYWKLLNDGILQASGDGWLRDENNRLILNKDGNRIGAENVETGLLNILYGGTKGNSYSSYDNDQKIRSFELMREAGIEYTYDQKKFSKEDMQIIMEDINNGKYNEKSMDFLKSITWDSKSTLNLNMNNVMEYAGDSVATNVFVRYYDSTVDGIIGDLIGRNITNIELRGVSDNASERFGNLLQEKASFYANVQALVDNKNTTVTGDYKGYLYNSDGTINTNVYVNYNNKHYGIDIGRSSSQSIEGSDIYMGLSGKVTENYWDPRAGWSVHTNYGYYFEDTYISTGIYGEYDHMQNPSPLWKNNFYTANTVIGKVGNTGAASTGPHLHYSVYTQPNNYFSNSTMKILFGDDYLNTAMTNSYNTKTVYDPTSFYLNNRKK